MGSLNIRGIGPELTILTARYSVLPMLHDSEMIRKSGYLFQRVLQSLTRKGFGKVKRFSAPQ